MKSPRLIDKESLIVVPIILMQFEFIKLINSSGYSTIMVYLRAKKFKRKNDKQPRTYFYLVEAKRTKNKVQQKVIRYLGTADTMLEDYKLLDTLKPTPPK